MQSEAVSEKVDEAAAPVMQAREQVLAKLRDEHAIGVVVAVRGDIIWADLFANTNLLARYWTKLVRSYAAESLTEGADRARCRAWPMRSTFSMRPRADPKPATAKWAFTAIVS